METLEQKREEVEELAHATRKHRNHIAGLTASYEADVEFSRRPAAEADADEKQKPAEGADSQLAASGDVFAELVGAATAAAGRTGSAQMMRVSELEFALREAAQRIEKMRGQNIILTTENNSLNDKVMRLEDDCVAYERRIRQLRHELRPKLDKYIASIEGLEGTANTLRLDFDLLLGMWKGKERVLQRAQREANEHRQVAEEVKSAEHRWQSDRVVMKRVLSRKERMARVAIAARQVSLEEGRAQQVTMNEMQTELEQAQNTIDRLRKQLADSESHCKSMDSQLQDVSRQLEEQTMESNRLRSEVATKTVHVEQLQQDLNVVTDREFFVAKKAEAIRLAEANLELSQAKTELEARLARAIERLYELNQDTSDLVMDTA